MVVATALGRWIEREGGLVGPIQISSRGGLRGLFVSEAVAAGTPLLAVPRHCTLHSDAVADDDASALRPHERLMLALLQARAAAARAPDDGLSLYVASIPTEIPLLRDWPDGALDALARQNTAASALAEAARAQRGAAARSCARVVAHAPFADDADLRWAEAAVRSRALDTSAAGGPRTLQLVPIFDMCNHRPAAADADASRRVVEVTSDGVAVLTAPEALRAGDEIAFPYDAGGGNAELLLDYGFGIGADGAAATAAPPEDPEAVAAVLE